MKKSVFKISIILIIITLVFSKIFCQPINNLVGDVVAPSATVASIGRYSDIPVGLYTGVPDISIPIGGVNIGPIGLDISLSYHSAGVKVSQLSSNVGLGWTLNAGGIVSRTVMDHPDDSSEGYFICGSSLSLSTYYSCGASAANCGQVKDGEPDLFNFSINGASGKFIFDKDGNVRQIKKSDVKIERIWDAPSANLSGFIITDPSGIKYYFGNGNIETSSPYPSSGYKTAWHLYKVESPDAKYSINLTYEDEGYGFRNRKSYYSANGSSSSGTYNEMAIVSKRIKTISNGFKTITFNYNNLRQDLDVISSYNAKSLDEIKIEEGVFCKRYAMEYDYFSNTVITGTGNAHKRLRLKSVEETSCDLTLNVPKYLFTYDGNADGTGFPHRFDKNIDHWGYYNGITNSQTSTSLFPPLSQWWEPTNNVCNGNSGTGTSNREANDNYSKKGILTKIQFPNGGTTEFTYEANRVPYTNPTAQEIHRVQNCGSPFNADCCGTPSGQPKITYSTTSFNQNQIATGTVKLTLEDISLYYNQGNCTGSNNSFNLKYKISVFKNSNNALVGTPYEFNFWVSPGTSSAGTKQTVNKNLWEFSLQADTLYKFKLEVTNGKGEWIVNGPYTYDRLAAGLRVKEKIVYDGISTANNIVIQYEYKKSSTNPLSSGVLSQVPHYCYVVCDLAPSNPVPTCASTIVSDMSALELSNYEGLEIGYERVVDKIVNNGWKESKFYASQNVYTNSYFFAPVMPSHLNSIMYEQNIYDQNNALKKRDIVVPDNLANYTQVNTPAYKTICGSGYFNTYPIYTVQNRIGSEESTIDGVNVATIYTYDAANRFTMPISKSVTNSDGKTHKEEYVYNFDYDNTSGLRDALVNKNIIATPFKTKKYVNNIQVDGTEKEYSWYNLTSGIKQTTATNGFPRPYKIYRDEYTWNASNILTGANKVLQTTIDNYDTNGNITSITAFGWSPETFEWNANGSLKKRTFNSHIKQYAYYTGTAMLNTFTDIDGQVVTYEYDKLSRVNKIRQRANNVVTDVFYNYKSVSDPNNWMKVRKTITPVAGSAANIIEDIQYLDGLGRPLQTVKKNQANGLKDLVVDAVAYDNKGRVVKKYLPFQSALSTGAIQTIPGGQGFTMIDYEPSPLNRVSAETPPSWYATTMAYGSNVANEVKLTYGTTPTYYAPGLLTKETKTDASNRVMITYKDKKGRVILSKNTKVGATASEVADTYTSYDDKDRVKTVYPPETNSSLTGLVFDYRYDQGDNMIYKKVPDQAAIDMVYNDMDLMTFYKDGNLGSLTYNENGIADQWMMTKYDNYGRPTGTGFFTSATTPAGNNNATAFTKQISWLTYGTAGIEFGKMKSSESLILGNYANTTTKIMENFTYDAYGRVISKLGNNHLNTGTGNQISYFTYDFLDGVLKDSTIQTTPAGSHKYVTRQTFDYIGRPLDTYHRIVTGTTDNGEKHISTLAYNFRGEVVSKSISRGNYAGPPVAGQTYLQKTDYTYNAQGWLTKINDPFLSGTADPLNPDFYDAFRLDLGYDTAPTSVTSLTPALDKSGNISQMTWQNRGQDVMGYNFDYNYLGQLLNSKYFDVIGAATSGTYSQKYNENLTYDNRGNILSLYRNTINGAGMLNIDNLTYGYTAGSNRLATVTDATANAQGFNPMGGAGYNYDLNGNTYANSYKQITDTKYYFNNLPKDITVNQGVSNINKIRFTYDASGRKLRKQVLNNANAVTYQQDYFGKIEYIGTTPIVEAIYHPEGRAVWNGTTWRYEFNVTDHLGNIRAVISDINDNKIINISTNQATNEIINVNSYYPFGLVMGGTFSNNTGTPDTRYQYNSKEMNSDLGLNLLDYGARWYDGAIGRFTSVDPLANKYPSWSPFNYVMNNPMRLVDKDGREPSQGGPGDPLSIFSGIQQKWQEFKNSLFGSGDDQPTDGEMYDETIALGKRLEKGVDYQTMLIPGGSFLNPNSTTEEKGVDLAATFIPGGNLVKTGGKVAGQIVIKSLVKEEKAILKLAKETFKGAEKLSKEANGLIQQMFKGNWNPGVGTREVFKGVLEARSKNGARVYFRHTDKGAEILGYSNKSNQQQVIDALKKVYGQ